MTPFSEISRSYKRCRTYQTLGISRRETECENATTAHNSSFGHDTKFTGVLGSLCLSLIPNPFLDTALSCPCDIPRLEMIAVEIKLMPEPLIDNDGNICVVERLIALEREKYYSDKL